MPTAAPSSNAATPASDPWSPTSWQHRAAAQQPVYEDAAARDAVIRALHGYPPLVFVGEVRRLRHQLAEAAVGKRFVLQGGDCAERFRDCTAERITRTMKILLQMSLILTYGMHRPTIRLARLAGQYAKPRSSPSETIGEATLPSYRGDIVNEEQFESAARRPNPARLLEAYHRSALTLNYVRALIAGGFADLHHPEHWKLDFLQDSPHNAEYSSIVRNIREAIQFIESLGGTRPEVLGSVDFFTSHEGLLLDYESALTRRGDDGRFYNMAAHMLWIGDRTRQLDGAHVEYFRGIDNPIGVKVGPTMSPDELVALIATLNPRKDAGRLMLITRMGEANVERHLPSLIRAVETLRTPVVWSVDPMHGNTIKTAGGHKTRNFDAILGELRRTIAIHKRFGTTVGGVHFELTGDDVTECTGGAVGLGENDLAQRYDTACDPRLNYFQALEMAFVIVELMGE